jgi:hypothetical protein
MAMARFTRKKKVLAFFTAGLVLVGGGVAYAYWTTSGTGTGTVATGTNVGITVNQTSTIAGLYPGGPAVDLAGTFTNTNSGAAYVTQVSVAVDPAWSEQADAGKPACTAGDFVLVQPAATNADVAAGTGVGAWAGASIRLANLGTNQDNCKSVDVDLVYSSN